jgi:uroporphyrinogen decarboxylase
MTDRENLIGLWRRTGYERMLPYIMLTPDLKRRFDAYCKETGYEPPKSAYKDLPYTAPIERRAPSFWLPYYGHEFKEGTTFSPYGVAHEPGSEACFHMTRMYHPLEKMTTLDELRAYPFPTYPKGPSQAQLDAAQALHAEGRFAMGNMQCTVWETSWYARGMEVLMMDMMTEPELAEFVLDTVTEHAVIQAQNYVLAGADGIFLGDDIGMQFTPMMSLELYREFLKPRLAKVISSAREIKPDVIVVYHSCGHATPYIPDLIEAGVDVLNPVQPESMNFEEILETYRGRLSYCGVLGTQTLMPFGSPEEVYETTTRYLDLVGPQGGLLACPTHVLEPEVPVENVVAYLEACRNYRPGK